MTWASPSCAARAAAGASLLFAFGGLDALAACPASAEQLSAEIDAAERAFAAIDTVGFKASVTAMRGSLGCLAAPPDPRLASRVHEVEALDAFFDQEQGRALLSLRAMVEVQPEADLSQDLAPAGGELRAWLSMARHMPTTLRATVTPPAGLTLLVDGVASSDLPADRPALVVLVGADGGVRWSGLSTGLAGLPAMALAPPPTPAPLPSPTPSPTPDEPREPRRLLRAAGGVALVSAGLWAGALLSAAQVDAVGEAIAAGEPRVGVEDRAAFDQLVTRTNALGVAGQVTGGLALGLGAVGLVVRW